MFKHVPGRFSIERSIAFLLCTAAAVLACLAFLGHRQFTQQDGFTALAQRTGSALEAVERVRQALLNAETGQRGYLLTSQQSYLEPYLTGAREAREGMAQVTQLLGSSREQQAAVSEMGRLTQEKLAELELTVDLHRRDQRGQALEVVRQNKGKLLMDRFRVVTAAMTALENVHLASRNAEIKQAQSAIERLFAMALTGLAVAFFGGYLVLRKNLQNRGETTALLRAGKRRLRAITDNLPVLISYIGKDGRYQFANEAYRSAWEMEPSSLVGQAVSSQFTPDVYAEIKPYIEAVLRGEQVQYERCSRDRGRCAYLHVTYVPDVNADGVVDGYYSMVLDITARKEAELSLAMSEERHRAVLTYAPDAFISLDIDGRVTEWNRQAEATFGWRRSEAMGQVLAELIIPEATRNAHTEGMRRFSSTGEGPAVNRRIEVVALHRDGSHIPVEITIAAVKQQDHSYTANAFLHNISERKEAQARLAASERLLRTITDNLPALVTHTDSKERYTFVNAHVSQMFGQDAAAMVGKTHREICGGRIYQAIEPHIRTVLQGRAVSFDSDGQIAGGHYEDRHYMTNYIPETDASGAVLGWITLTFDVTERRQAELALARQERMLRTITDNLPVLISYIDSAEKIRFINATLEQWVGIKPKDAIDRPFEEVVGVGHYAGRQGPLLRALAGERTEFQIESTALGRHRHIHSLYIPDFGGDGAVAGVFTLSTDVTASMAAQRELSELARVDSLTGLPNRRQFEEKLGEAAARAQRDGRSLAVMFLDIDHFKPVNDSHGHAMGDAVLREFAGRLRAAVRVTDLPARLAGDEFVVILEGLHDEKDAGVVARKIVDAMRPPFACLAQTSSMRVTTSVGVAFAVDAGVSVEALLHCADEALYKAKGAGRDCFRLLPCLA